VLPHSRARWSASIRLLVPMPVLIPK
jgi:hypothetical protein